MWWRYLTKGGIAKLTQQRIEQARAAGRLHIAAVTLWEIAMLVHDGKLRIDDTVPRWLDTALARSRTTVAPLEPGAAHEAARLAGKLEPPSCQIVGTAVHLGMPVATRDGWMLEGARRVGIEVLQA